MYLALVMLRFGIFKATLGSFQIFKACWNQSQGYTDGMGPELLPEKPKAGLRKWEESQAERI